MGPLGSGPSWYWADFNWVGIGPSWFWADLEMGRLDSGASFMYSESDALSIHCATISPIPHIQIKYLQPWNRADIKNKNVKYDKDKYLTLGFFKFAHKLYVRLAVSV